MSDEKIKHEEYTGEKCPNCESEDINGDSLEPIGATQSSRKIDCENCGATWVEILEVVTFVDLEVPKKE